MTHELNDDILEHFGMKGMRWGVRKERTSESESGGTKEGMSTKKKAAIVGGVLVGAAIAGMIVRSHGSTPMSKVSAKPFHNETYDRTQRLLGMNSHRRYNDIVKASSTMRISREQGARLVRLNTERYRNQSYRLARQNQWDMRERKRMGL